MYVAKSLLNEINIVPNNKEILYKLLYLICFRLRLIHIRNLTQFVYLYLLRIVSTF